MGRSKSERQDDSGIGKRITIDEQKALAIALFGVSALEASRMTLYEFELYSLAYEFKRQKEMETASFQAWQNNQAKAVKTIGSGKNMKTKPYFKTFKAFYDSDKEFNLILGLDNIKSARREISLADLNRRVNKRGG